MPYRSAARPAATRTRSSVIALVVTVVVVGLTGCGSSTAGAVRQSSTTTTRAPRASTTIAPPALPVAPVQWTPCGDLQCGSVTVPLNYADPAGPTIQIAVARHPAEDPSLRIGSLVINPGGPGTSGIDDLPNELSVLTPELLERFDIVSFDPRGVDRSSPVSCSAPPSAGSGSGSTGGSGGGGGAIDPVPTTAAERRALLLNDQEFARQCQQYSASILPYVGTVDTARDLDRIRQALGDAGLTFMGNSYGTLLGATYAELFPTHLRAMVLDSAIDPALSTTAYAAGQAESLESEFTAFATWCAADVDCPWRPTGDPTTALLDLIRASQNRPLTVASGGTAGPGQLYDTLLSGLESQSSWPTLAAALAQAETGNGAPAATITGGYQNGGSSNGADAEQAIDCLDHPVNRSVSSYPALADRLARSAPVFGPLLAWALLACAVWPVPPTRHQAPASDPGAPPVLVVGTTGDPVTPYLWSVDLAKELAGGVLLTWQGRSHVAYFYSPCVRDVVQAYLVDGNLPAPGTTCTD